jgi:hypothetical protein
MAQWLYITPHILALISALNGFQEEITREVLEGHVAGYSTTTHDLIHDLVPFT